MTFLQFHSLSLLIPLFFGVAGYWCGRTKVPQKHVALHALYLTVVIIIVTLISIGHDLFIRPVPEFSLIQLNPVNLFMVSLIVIMAWILVRFSQNYMAGDQREGHYYRWLLLTLGAVSLTVMANHLLLLWIGWLSISLSLHKLLTFYPDRPRAILAAHKKFLLARTAEVLLLTAIVLIYLTHNTFYLTELNTLFHHTLTNNQPLSTLEHIAAVMLALTALIKCAQLPMHGWLIQVVEAPTPVSGLLHAGVINLGGFLLIIFAPLIVLADYAQWMILIVAGLSTLLSALIMTTRISYKVRLAWSTSAQMGFMLLECALGYYELALLHLVAHSAYKAHAFLNSGHAVYSDLKQRLSPQILPPLKDWFFALVGSFTLTALSIYITDYNGPMSLWLLFAMALSILLIQQPRPNISAPHLMILIFAGFIILSYALQKTAVTLGLGFPASYKEHALSWPDLWAMLVFTVLFLLHLLRFYRAHWRFIQRLSLALYAGLYLDEWFTRMTLKIWPIKRLSYHRRKHFSSNKHEEKSL